MNTEEQKKEKRNRVLKILAGLVVVFLLMGCCSVGGLIFLGSDESISAPVTLATRVATVTIPGVVTTEANASNATAIAAPLPTSTPWTPQPTRTPRPTQIPQPTVVPTPLPEVEVFTGSGDAVLDVSFTDPARFLHITGNAGGHHFAVQSYDGRGEYLDLLVNTTDPYDGFLPFDWGDDDATERLQVTATGEWVIEVVPLAMVPEIVERVLEPPGTYEGNGDDVILIFGLAGTATITGNAEGRHFAVIGRGENHQLLVNTTEPYEGVRIVEEGILMLEIKATGPWTIEVTAR